MRFVDLHMVDIFEGMMFLNLLAADHIGNCIRYIRTGKMMTKHKAMLTLLLNLSRDVLVVKTLDITHLEDPSPYISPEDYVLLITQPFTWSSRTTAGLFHSMPALCAGMQKFSLMNIALATRSITNIHLWRMQCFLQPWFRKQKISQSVISLTITIIGPLPYDVRKKPEKRERKTEMPKSCLYWRLQPHFILVESSHSSQLALGEIEINKTPRKKRLQCNKGKIFPQ